MLRKKRKRESEGPRTIMENGKEVIGTIKNLSVTNLKDSQCFNYDIEYEDPVKDSMTIKSIVTPAVVKDTMCITEKDLPLRAVFYVYNKQVHLYALINPPVAKMSQRKALKYLWIATPYIILAISVIFAAYFSSKGNYNLAMNLGFGGLLICGLFFCIRHYDSIRW
jgi:hypothetical protein